VPVRYWIAAAGMLLAALVAALWYQQSAPEPAPLIVEPVASDNQDGSITIHVSGEVVTPGLVEVSPTARVADAVAAAGGTTRDAALDAVNLAASLRDGAERLRRLVDETLSAPDADTDSV